MAAATQNTETGVFIFMYKHMQLKQAELQQAGWKTVPLGQTRSNGKLKQAEGFLVFVRDRNFDDFLKKSSKKDIANPCSQRDPGTGSGFPDPGGIFKCRASCIC